MHSTFTFNMHHSLCNTCAPATLNAPFLKTLEIKMNTLCLIQMFSFFNRFPLYILPKAWNNAGIVTFYNNKTTFKIAFLKTLNQHILPPPPFLPRRPGAEKQGGGGRVSRVTLFKVSPDRPQALLPITHCSAAFKRNAWDICCFWRGGGGEGVGVGRGRDFGQFDGPWRVRSKRKVRDRRNWFCVVLKLHNKHFNISF